MPFAQIILVRMTDLIGKSFECVCQRKRGKLLLHKIGTREVVGGSLGEHYRS